MDWGRKGASWRRWVQWPSVVALAVAAVYHGAWFVALSAPLQPRERGHSVSRGIVLELRLLPLPPPSPPMAPEAAERVAERRTVPVPARRGAGSARVLHNVPEPAPVPPPIAAVAKVVETTPAAAPSASTALPPPLLDTEATRRAIRELARVKPMSELGAEAGGEPRRLSEEERLGREIARAGKGECLRGEYFGGGGGLLSLPFWIAAELRDKCRR
jgi:hypothetical protein